ncbi:trigger factor [bacterium F11]|nr:trigger factor [bacterium F11]
MIMGLKDNIKVKLGDEKDCIQTVTVEMPQARVKEQIEKAFLTVQNQAKLPGFRPGKTPLELVRKNFKENAFARAEDNLLREGVAEALQQKNIQAIQTPVILNLKFDPEKPFHFEFQVEIAPTFKLNSYKGLKVTQEKTSTTEEDVQKKLDEIANANAKLIESKEETLALTHLANINYEGFIDGKPIEGTKAENFLIDLSAPQAIAGLAEGLIGAKTGETREVEVTFPEESPAKHLAGKKAKFNVTINAIKEKKVPKLDDDFAKDLGLESFEQLRSRIKGNMEKEAEQANRKQLEGQLIDKLLEENKFSVPKSLIQSQSERLVDRQRYRLNQQGYKKAEQDKILDGIKPQMAQQAEREVRLAYVLNQIASHEKLEVTDADLKNRIDEVVAQSQPAERESMEKLLNGTYRDQIRSEMKDGKIFDWLISHAKIKVITGGSK